MKKLKLMAKIVVLTFLMALLYVTIYFVFWGMLLGMASVGSAVDDILHGDKEDQVDGVQEETVNKSKYDELYAELNQCQIRVSEVDIVCEDENGQKDGDYRLVIEKDGFNMRSIGIKSRSDVIIGTLNFEEDRFVSATQVFDLSQNYSRIIFSISYIGTGCAPGEGEECIRWINEANQDVEEIGGIWEYDLETKEFRHIVNCPSGVWIEEMISDTPLLIFRGEYNDKLGVHSLNVETGEVRYMYNDQLIEVESFLPE